MYQTCGSEVHGFAVGDVVQILKHGTHAGTEAVVTNPDDLYGEKELAVLRTSGPKAGRSAMYMRDEVKRTGKTMLPEQIEEFRSAVPTDPRIRGLRKSDSGTSVAMSVA